MNKAILMGRLVRDPELRTTQSGISVVLLLLWTVGSRTIKVSVG